MSNKIKSVITTNVANKVPTPEQIENTSLAVNTADKKLYVKRNNEVVKIGVTEEELNLAIQQQAEFIQQEVNNTFNIVAKKVFAGNIVINTDTTHSIDLSTYFSVEELNELDPNGCNIIVRTVDTDYNSPTFNVLIDATAIVTTGVSQNRYIRIHNHYEQNLTFYVRIDIPVK